MQSKEPSGRLMQGSIKIKSENMKSYTRFIWIINFIIAIRKENLGS